MSCFPLPWSFSQTHFSEAPPFSKDIHRETNPSRLRRGFGVAEPGGQQAALFYRCFQLGCASLPHFVSLFFGFPLSDANISATSVVGT